MALIRAFLENAYYHCLHYIIDKKLHWIERLFWASCLVLSLAATLFIVIITTKDYFSMKSSTRVETDYLKWKTAYPSIFICEKRENPQHIDRLLDRIGFKTNDKQSRIDIANFVRLTSFVSPYGSTVWNAHPCRGDFCKFWELYNNNLSALLPHIRSNCSELITSCAFNNKVFDCCEHFLPMQTNEGTCYAINNYHAMLAADLPSLKVGRYIDALPLLLTSQTVNLSIELAHLDVYPWPASPADLPQKMALSEQLLIKTRIKDIHLRVEKTYRHMSLDELDAGRRNCKIWNEPGGLWGAHMYSKGGCEIECLKRAQRRHCGCVVHLLVAGTKGAPRETLCNETGILCAIDKLRHQENSCKCQRICLIYEIYLVGIISNYSFDRTLGFRDDRSVQRVNIIVRPPILQYHQYMNMERWYFIVSIGGAIGLFVGCSFLSLAQLIYYLLVRPIYDCYRKQ